jgi:transcription elongation factor GreA
VVEVDGQIDEFTILGTLEANPSIGKISNESPVGRALLSHKAGEEIIISSNIKTIYKIKEIRYEL